MGICEGSQTPACGLAPPLKAQASVSFPAPRSVSFPAPRSAWCRCGMEYEIGCPWCNHPHTFVVVSGEARHVRGTCAHTKHADTMTYLISRALAQHATRTDARQLVDNFGIKGLF